MPTTREALFATISRLGENLVMREGQDKGEWEIWFAGDDYGLTPAEFEKVRDEEEYYLEESYRVASIHGEATIRGIFLKRETAGLNLLSVFMRLLQREPQLSGEIVDVDFELRPVGDKIFIDVIAMGVAWTADGPDPDAPFERFQIGQFAYDAERGYIAAREPEPPRPIGRVRKHLLDWEDLDEF